MDNSKEDLQMTLPLNFLAKFLTLISIRQWIKNRKIKKQLELEAYVSQVLELEDEYDFANYN